MSDRSAIRQFMQVTTPHQVGDKLGANLDSRDYRLLRARLVLSEALELCDALGVVVLPQFSTIVDDGDVELRVVGEGSLVKVADACADLRYVVVGTEIAFGIDGERTFAEVHASNMTKIRPDGSVRLDMGGKVLKPDGYMPPDLPKVLRGQAYSEKGLEG